MKEYTVLAIGNSFSHDAAKYVHAIAQASDIKTKIVNLYIPGCPLIRHCENIESGAPAYTYELNGDSTGNKISIKEALKEEDWSFVITQQASPNSGISETYYPYVVTLMNYISEQSPNARRFLQKTWAYELDSTHRGFEFYGSSQAEMYRRLSISYAEAAEKTSTEIIPTADVIQKLRSLPPFDYANGGISLCRDGFHLNRIYGRYAASSTWCAKLFGIKMTENHYVLEGDEVDYSLVELIKKTVDELVK